MKKYCKSVFSFLFILVVIAISSCNSLPESGNDESSVTDASITDASSENYNESMTKDPFAVDTSSGINPPAFVSVDEYPEGFNEEKIMDHLKKTYPDSYIDGDYTVYGMNLYKTGEFKVTYELSLNGYRALGCTVSATVLNGEIVETSNTLKNISRDQLQISAPELKQEDMTAAYTQTYDTLNEKYPGMSVLETEAVKIFHVDSGKYCYHVCITYKTASGGIGKRDTCYPLN